MQKMINVLWWMASSRRAWLVLLFMVFASIFGTGVIRLVQYDLPMWRADYAEAARTAVMFGHAPGESELPATPLTGQLGVVDRFLDYCWSRWYRYEDWACGDRVPAKFNHGLRLYRKEKKYKDARDAYQDALAACCDEDGHVKPQYRKLASDISVLIGNTYDHEEKLQDAEPWYKRAMDPERNPKNLTATYDIERLQDSPPSGGSSSGSKQPSQQDQKKGGKPRPKI